ncbi:LysR family transcriptional regulator [Methylobacterium sp. A49B]
MNDPFDGILSRDQIRTLVGVVEQGSFQRAAAVLGVQQPAVTQQVRRLEERLGRRLFDRTAAGVTLTIDGEAVLIYARAMAGLGAEMMRHFGKPAQDTVIRIGIGEEIGRTALPNVLAVFARLHSRFRFEAACALPSRDLCKALDDGQLDAVVARRDPDRQSGHVISTEPTIWVGRPDMRLPLADPVPLVLPTAGILRDTVLTTLAGASRTWRIVFAGASLAILEAAIRAGLGVSACTPRTELTEAAPLGVAAGLPQLPDSVFVLEEAQTRRSDAVVAFGEVLRTAARLSFAGGGTVSEPNVDTSRP